MGHLQHSSATSAAATVTLQPMYSRGWKQLLPGNVKLTCLYDGLLQSVKGEGRTTHLLMKNAIKVRCLWLRVKTIQQCNSKELNNQW